MKPHSDSAFSDSSLRSLYKTNDILVSDCDEVSNHEFYNLIDKTDISNPASPFKKIITTNNDKEQNLNNKNEKFKYKPRFLFNKYDEPGQNSENRVTADMENMDKLTNRMKNMFDEMQLKKIVSLTAVLKSNQAGTENKNRASKELVKNVLDIELPKQINKIIGSRAAADELAKLSTELYLLGVGDEVEKDDAQADDEMSDTHINPKLMRTHSNSVIQPNISKDKEGIEKFSNTQFESYQLTEQIEKHSNTQTNLSTKPNFIFPSSATPIFPQKIHKIEKRIKILEKIMKNLKLNVKSLQKRVHSTPVLAANSNNLTETNKENCIAASQIKLYSSTRTLGLTSNCSSKQMENPYDELFYEFRQRKMNLLHYKKSERSLLFNQYPILKWNKPVLNFATVDYKVLQRPRFIRD